MVDPFTPQDRDRLHSDLLVAHEAADLNTLVALYRKAAETANDAGSSDRAAFYLTHAMVFALEAGHPDAEGIRAQLRSQGRA
ncbi:MAG: hypothetical protein AAFN59_02155 [Pseudomonadota bacterium]